MAAGNRSVLVILDSARVADRTRAAQTVFPALDHFGVAYEVLECRDYCTLPTAHVSERAAYVLAHDGAGAAMKPALADELAAAVRDGAGLLTFDREMATWPEALRTLLPSGGVPGTTDVLRFPAAPDFITFGHEQGEEVPLTAPLATLSLPTDDGGIVPLVADGMGACIVASMQVDKGRVVFFGAGEELYSEEVFGHVRGLDGLMWRSLVWVAAKPFPMRSVPPMVSARFDDCNGTYGSFAYVDVLNRYGISPNVGLFIDELGPTDWAAAKRLFDKGGADFSMHAFRDDFYKASPKYQPYALLADKPDLSDGGQHTLFEGLSLDHISGRDLDDATVKRNFARMDATFARAGITPGRILNAHFGEIGWRAVPEFLARGVDLPCNNSVVGQLYGNQPVWRPRPYDCRGTNGRHGLVIDHCPQHPGLTMVGISAAHLGSTHMLSDILHGNTPFHGEAAQSQPRRAAERGIANVHLGLDSLAYGNIMAHEERVDAISPADWETIVAGIVNGLDGWEPQFTSREGISVLCRNLLNSALVHAQCADGRLHCELCGQTDATSPLTIWENEGDHCRRRTIDVESFDGFTVVEA
ncbi:MAG: hypothetical protein HN380_01810 [Victivallales bacterium]|nr:hypothetical protein [Victivallales bacterium]